jgi:hypothetical protein
MSTNLFFLGFFFDKFVTIRVIRGHLSFKECALPLLPVVFQYAIILKVKP